MKSEKDNHRAPIPVNDAYFAHRYITPPRRKTKRLLITLSILTICALIFGAILTFYFIGTNASRSQVNTEDAARTSLLFSEPDDNDNDHDGFPDVLFDSSSDEGDLTVYENGPEEANYCPTEHTPAEFMNAWIELFKSTNHLTDTQLKQFVTIVGISLNGSFHKGDHCVLTITYDAKVDWSISRKSDEIEIDSPSMLPSELAQHLSTKFVQLDGTSQNTLSTIDFNQKLVFKNKREALSYFSEQKNIPVKTMISATIGIATDTTTPSIAIRGIDYSGSKTMCYDAVLSLTTRAITNFTEIGCTPGFRE